MRGTKLLPITRVAAFALGTAIGLASCAPADPNGQEHMTAFASIWLTSEPAEPAQPVRVELTAAQDPAFHRAHTFVAGAILRGSMPISSGRYRLVGLGGACAFEFFLGAEREADVVIRLLDNGSCAFVVVREHGEEVSHDGPEIVVGP